MNNQGESESSGDGPPNTKKGEGRASEERTIEAGKIQVERKVFTFNLKENIRGRFLRITEDVGGRRDSIILPATGLRDFRTQLDRMITASESNP